MLPNGFQKIFRWGKRIRSWSLPERLPRLAQLPPQFIRAEPIPDSICGSGGGSGVAGRGRQRCHVWERFSEQLLQHNGHPKAVTQIAIDMSPAYEKGVRENFGNAQIVFDKFHVVTRSFKRWKKCAAKKRGKTRWRGSNWSGPVGCGARTRNAGRPKNSRASCN